MAEITAEQSRDGLTEQMDAFLKDHRLMVLATTGTDGAPKVSTVLYHYDGDDIVISSKQYTAHTRNVRRQPTIGFVVNDGRAQLIVYGRAEVLENDPERLDLTKRVMGRMGGGGDAPSPGEQAKQDAESIKRLDEQERTVIRIQPERGQINP